ncbi:hypothetical protein ACVIM8_001505 [Bradyrhizobium sp. USDA 4529]
MTFRATGELKMIKSRYLKVAFAAAVASVLAATQAARADEQFFPLQSYRVGPYAAGGTGFFGGFIDYLNLINIPRRRRQWRQVDLGRGRDPVRGRARRRGL